MIELTQKQMDLLVVIERFIDTHKYSPTQTELSQLVGLQSQSGVASMIYRLTRKGAISFNPTHHRSITIIARSGDCTIKETQSTGFYSERQEITHLLDHLKFGWKTIVDVHQTLQRQAGKQLSLDLTEKLIKDSPRITKAWASGTAILMVSNTAGVNPNQFTQD